MTAHPLDDQCCEECFKRVFSKARLKAYDFNHIVGKEVLTKGENNKT